MAQRPHPPIVIAAGQRPGLEGTGGLAGDCKSDTGAGGKDRTATDQGKCLSAGKGHRTFSILIRFRTI